MTRGRPPGLVLAAGALATLAGLIPAAAVAAALLWSRRSGPAAPAGLAPALAFAGAVLALVLVLSLAAAVRVARHIRAVQRALERMAWGDVPEPAPPGPVAELDDLVVALDGARRYLAAVRGGVGWAPSPPEPADSAACRAAGAVASEIAPSIRRLRGLLELEAAGQGSVPGAAALPLRPRLLAEVARLERAAGQLEAVAGRVTARRAPVALNAAVAVCVDALRPTAAASGCALSFDPDPTIGRVPADLDVLHRVVAHLIRQAIRAAPSGHVDVRTQQLDGEAMIAVRDDGPGVAPEELPRLFEPFHAPRNGGAPLELAACRELARAHGARLAAVNVHPLGLEVSLRLPEQEGPPPESEASPAGTGTSAGRRSPTPREGP